MNMLNKEFGYNGNRNSRCLNGWGPGRELFYCFFSCCLDSSAHPLVALPVCHLAGTAAVPDRQQHSTQGIKTKLHMQI
jgi:hypothetical protein